jgi:hypothetical protein
MTRDDWRVFLAFADKHLGSPPPRRSSIFTAGVRIALSPESRAKFGCRHNPDVPATVSKRC